jgi:uncharacterized membrane protein YuzA (DUF378 family)
MGQIYRILIATAFLALLALAIPGTERTIVSAEDPVAAPTLNWLYMYMRDSTGMSPEAPDIQQPELTATIPNGFVKDGPLGKGWLPFMGHVYWRDVGTWNTDPVKNTINLGGEVRIVMYVRGSSGSQNAINCDFIFIISRAGESTPILQLQRNNVNIPRAADEPAMFETVGSFPFTNDTTIKAGTAMSLNIQARCSGGGILVYGSQIYKSGFSFSANSLYPHQLILSKEGAGIEYKDAFLVPWMKLQRRMVVDELVLDNQLQTTEINSANQTRILFWPAIIEPGDHDVLVSLCYDSTGLGNVSATSIIKITVKQRDLSAVVWGIIKTIIYVLLGIAAIVILLMVYRAHRVKVWKRRFRALPEEERSLSMKQRKSAWKAGRKEDAKLKHDARLERRRRMEEEEAERGFTLMKRKETKPLEPKRSRFRRSPREPAPFAPPKKLTLDEVKELDLDL